MMSFPLMTAITLCSLSLISVSCSEYQTVEVQPGRRVTLQCSNISEYESVTFWFRLVDGTKAHCISVMFSSNSKAQFCDGFQNGTFEMRSNRSQIFLTIKQVDLSDCGLYFCGFYTNGLVLFSAIHLIVKVKGSDEPQSYCHKSNSESDGKTKLVIVILGVLTGLLVVVNIGLVVKNRKLQRADKEEENPEQSEIVGSNDLTYAAVTFHQGKAGRRQLEPNVIYAATR